MDTINIGHAHNFWIPLSLFTLGQGWRRYASLKCADVREEQGVWCIDINETGDRKSVKTSEQRIVPIHPLLLEFGLLDYVKLVPTSGKLSLSCDT